jgi:hypothetical protein
MYKVKHKLCPAPIQEIFRENENAPNLRMDGDWVVPKARTVNYGIETIRYRGPVTWNLLPKEIKSLETLESFKENIKKWKPQGCTCRLCKIFITKLGYVEIRT